MILERRMNLTHYKQKKKLGITHHPEDQPLDLNKLYEKAKKKKKEEQDK